SAPRIEHVSCRSRRRKAVGAAVHLVAGAMLNYAVKRLGLAVVVVAVVIAVLFLMIYIIPGDPLTVARGLRANPALVAELRARMGLDQPIYVQLFHFYRSVLTGDLGSDVLSDEPVLAIILQVMPYTLALILG